MPKISTYTELLTADPDDLLAIVDVSESETKKIQKGNLVTGGNGDGVPVGSCLLWFTDTPPDGWLVCGYDYSRATYAELFALWGTTYGEGDGSTTFGTPKMFGRSPLIAGSGVGLTPRALGDTGGEEEHQLTTPEMPSHNHVINTCWDTTPGVVNAVLNTTRPYAGTLYTGDTGGGGSHNTMHPFMCCHLIVYAGG